MDIEDRLADEADRIHDNAPECSECTRPLGYGTGREICFQCEDKRHANCQFQVETDEDEDGTHTYVKCLDHHEYISSELAEQVMA